MIAIIKCKTPYFLNKRNHLFISFALRNDVSFRCLLWWPTLLVLGEFIHLVKGKFICSEINRVFPLTLDPLVKGLSESIVFDNSTPIIPQGLYNNVKANPSLCHYTFDEGHDFHHSLPTYSDNIIVHDKFFEGDVSREL